VAPVVLSRLRRPVCKENFSDAGHVAVNGPLIGLMQQAQCSVSGALYINKLAGDWFLLGNIPNYPDTVPIVAINGLQSIYSTMTVREKYIFRMQLAVN